MRFGEWGHCSYETLAQKVKQEIHTIFMTFIRMLSVALNRIS